MVAEPSEWIARTSSRREFLLAVDRIEEGPALFIAEGGTGSGRGMLVDEAARLLEGSGRDVRIAHLLGTDRLHSGHLAEQLELSDRPLEGPAALLVKEAQSADATSIGLLGRLLASGAPTVVILGLAPPPADIAIILDRLAETTGRYGVVHRIRLEPLTQAELEEIADPETAGELLAATAGDPVALAGLLATW